jgi:putative serine protease PepD
VDLNGKLVGIASQVRTHTDWSENSGVGFFTQSDKIIQSLADLKAGRNIKAPARPFLGVSHVENATEVRGVKLEEVIPASAAANARLQAGDVIVAVDGMDTQSWPALVRILKAHHPGDSIEITYQRGSVTTRAQTVLTSRKDVR